ncbi:Peptide N(4) (N acetyl beta) [Echinococcus multilocularis]|uniref:Peptide N(4) (N acetyl beta) n=1 Tax=Echinococcus multilocularis TaxID=6211 RepID=A0A068XV94_ECHMU|nr:Peptide N(4) (N acetyl beta) [Echinococcus multilocularis]
MREIETVEDFDKLCQSTASVDKILVVDFYAVWCRPCSRASPLYEKLSYRYHYTDVYFIKVNVDACAELTHRELINSLPTFKLYKDGSCIRTFTGGNVDALEKAIDEAYLDESVKELLANSSSPTFQKAKAKLLSVANVAAAKVAVGKSFEINLSDPVFEKYFLVTPGCMQFLFSMGFQELTESLILPSNSSRRQINKLIRQLRGPPPPRISPKENTLLSKLEDYRHYVALYANPAYQVLARKAVPLDNLLKEAADLSRTSPKNVGPYSLLRALLRWFKEDFFTWTQDQVCDNCGSIMVAKSGHPTEAEFVEGSAHFVEIYTCPTSSSHPQKRFPRFNNPAKLLQTKEGRCGEWAGCFCFILASLRKANGDGKKADADDDDAKGPPWFPGVRLVLDISDHVFCEVWLTDLEDLAQERAALSNEGRWIHVDPCEGLVDVPLVYEQGWKKNLSYMFAFTVPPPTEDALLRYEGVDVADVVWKYSTDFKAVCRRRKSVSENRLARYLAQVHDEAAQAIPDYENAPFGLPTTVQELAVMMVPPRPSLESLQGRKSGSESWRRSRLEFGIAPLPWEGSGFVINPTPAELSQSCVYIRYSCSLDAYARPYHKEAPAATNDDSEVSSQRSNEGPKYLKEVYKQGWTSMALRWRNIARKVEKDWKMVYLARKAGCQSYEDGVIEWLIDLSDTEYSVKAVTLFATMAIFEERSKVTLDVTTDISKSRSLSVGSAPFSACADFAGAKQVRLTARLWNELENTDPSVWQKSQIFRQKETDHDTWPLEFKVSLQKDEKKDKK